jgi:hypothetical protein
MKKLLVFAIPLLTLIGCSSPLAPQQDEETSVRAAKAKVALEAAKRQPDDRIAAN